MQSLGPTWETVINQKKKYFQNKPHESEAFLLYKVFINK